MKVHKSTAGLQALSERDKRLTSKMRMLLVTIDGSYDEAELRLIAKNIGAPPDAFDQLLALGLVTTAKAETAVLEGKPSEQASAPPELDAFGRFRMAASIMNELASDSMGLKSLFFVLKVERCASIEDVAQLMPTLEPAVVKAHGQAAADQLLKPLRALVVQTH